jgi:hypothetical protein
MVLVKKRRAIDAFCVEVRDICHRVGAGAFEYAGSRLAQARQSYVLQSIRLRHLASPSGGCRAGPGMLGTRGGLVKAPKIRRRFAYESSSAPPLAGRVFGPAGRNRRRFDRTLKTPQERKKHTARGTGSRRASKPGVPLPITSPASITHRDECRDPWDPRSRSQPKARSILVPDAGLWDSRAGNRQNVRRLMRSGDGRL